MILRHNKPILLLFSFEFKWKLRIFKRFLWNRFKSFETSQILQHFQKNISWKITFCPSKCKQQNYTKLLKAHNSLKILLCIINLKTFFLSLKSRTDHIITNTIRTKFADCTVLTIAHRLNTIENSDRIMVMNAGQIAEFDTIENLLQNPNGMLKQLYNTASNNFW